MNTRKLPFRRPRHPSGRARAALAALSMLFVMGTAARAEGELNIFNWADYVNPEVLKAFEKETGTKINLANYSSNEEMLAKLQGGATGYDIVFPSVHMQDIMAKLDLLARTDI